MPKTNHTAAYGIDTHAFADYIRSFPKISLKDTPCVIHKCAPTLFRNEDYEYYACAQCKNKSTFTNAFPHGLGNRRSSYWDDPDDFPYGRDHEGGFYGD